MMADRKKGMQDIGDTMLELQSLAQDIGLELNK